MKAIYVELFKPAKLDGFDTWYKGTHAPSLQKIRGVTNFLGHYSAADVMFRDERPFGPHLGMFELDAPQDSLASLAQQLQSAARKDFEARNQGEQNDLNAAVFAQVSEVGDNSKSPATSFLVYTDPVAGQADEYNKWYNDIHLPDLMKIPNFFAAVRYKMVAGAGNGVKWPFTQQYLAIYKLSSQSNADCVNAGAEIAKRRNTPLMMISPAMATDVHAHFYIREG